MLGLLERERRRGDRVPPSKSSAGSLQHGGDVFLAASSFLRRAVPGVETNEQQVDTAPLIAGLKGTVLLLRGLPRVRVTLSDSPAGLRLRQYFDHRTWGIHHSRIAQGVLPLPDEPGEYLRGRSRQALRTNIRKAREAGITCRQLHHLDERRGAALQLRARVPGMWQWSNEQFSLPEDIWWAGRTSRGQTVAFAQVTVDREWALLRSFASSDRPSRYLLHAVLVDVLVASGVRYLAVDGPMAPLLEPSLQYWQRLLGFDVVHLSVSRQPLVRNATSRVDVPKLDVPSDYAAAQAAEGSPDVVGAPSP
jgi:hypothetical protein